VKLLPPLVRAAVSLVLALALASCGGGSTAGPLAATDAATTPAARTPTTATAPPARAPAPATTASAPAAPRTTAPVPRLVPRTTRPLRRQPSGGAAAPTPAAVEPLPSPAGTPPPQHAPSEPDPQPTASLLDERAVLTLVRRISPSHYIQQGTVVGTYDGTMEVEARITSKGVLVRFTATLPGGTISGRGTAVAILDSTTWPGLRGTAKLTGGTGRFAGLHGRRLKVTGRAKPDASKAHVRLAGSVIR
jgi:hypothetical protein